MRKIFAIALNDYQLVVFTKSFLISLVLPLFLYGGMFALSIFIKGRTDLTERTTAIIDRTGVLTAPLNEAMIQRNRGEEVFRNGRQIAPKFSLEVIDPAGRNDRELMAELSDRVRDKEIYAFLIIGPGFLDPDARDGDTLAYYSDAPAYLDLPNWLGRNLRSIAEEIRFEDSGLNLREIRRLMSFTDLNRFGLPELDADGNLTDPREENEAATFLIPFGLVMLMFFSIQMATPILLNSVIEEKMQRIAEVLLSAVSSFQLLAGKILAGTAIGLTFSAVYLVTLALSLQAFEVVGWVQPGVYPFFILFLLIGLLTFGSLFAAVSSACQDLKDTQNLAGGVVLLLVLPMILAITITISPDSGFARVISLIPPFSPMTMMARLAISPGPHLWEVLLAVTLNALFALFTIWAASRIFRIGMLTQGKAPSFRELITWIWRD